MAIKVILDKNPIRLSYPALFQPRESKSGGNARYQATLLIPKDDQQTVSMLMSAFQNEMAAAAQPGGAWNGATPPNPTTTWYDGDGVQPKSGEPWGDECKGHWILRTSSTTRPDVVDERGNRAMDATKFYAGCYCYFSITIKAYNNENGKGVGAYLNCVMFAKDGDPLEAHSSAKDDFASLIAAHQTAPAMPGMTGGQQPAPNMAPQMPTGFGGMAMPNPTMQQPAGPAMPGMPNFMNQ